MLRNVALTLAAVTREWLHFHRLGDRRGAHPGVVPRLVAQVAALLVKWSGRHCTVWGGRGRPVAAAHACSWRGLRDAQWGAVVDARGEGERDNSTVGRSRRAAARL